MNAADPSPHANASPSRLARIAQARQSLMQDGRAVTPGWVAPWVERSWQRCLDSGLRPGSQVSFSQVTALKLRHTREANHSLIAAAQPMLGSL